MRHDPDSLLTEPAHDHDGGLSHDLRTLARQATDRRQLLARLLAGALMPMPLLGCGGSSSDAASGTASTSTPGTTTTPTTGSTTTTVTPTTPPTTSTTSTTPTPTTPGTTSTTPTTTTTSCSEIPNETGGPYPGDGTNTVNGSTANALTLSGIQRSNIVTSFAGASGAAVGVPLAITLKVVNTKASCAALSGFAVYLWHCDQLGRYSMYSSGVTGENYLRGLQVTDSSGSVTFTSVYPACYAGRWPHIHFEVYSSAASAINGRNAIKTSQLAMPDAANQLVFATTNYSGSAANYRGVSLASDNVFSDGVSLETPTITGSVAAGYAIDLQVGVSV
ncbi:MAG: hypothetical protein RLZZ401_2207 [Pseudomonadota bacterium]